MADETPEVLPENPLGDGNLSNKPRNMFELFDKTRPEKPRVLNEGDDDHVDNNQQDLTDEEKKEQLFRSAAIKCAQMEDDLSQIMDQTTDEEFKERNNVYHAFFYKRGGGEYNNRKYSAIVSYDEKIYDHREKSVAVEYREGLVEDANLIGIDTDRALKITLHTDEKTREAYEEFAKKDPDLAGNVSTFYYFTKEGEYGKVSRIPKDVPVDLGRVRLYSDRRDVVVSIYESEMTAGDFEIAGRALKMLKNRMLGITDEAEEQEAQGK
jgi:hypothetical protein